MLLVALGIAFGLAMDAVAVTIAVSLAPGGISARGLVRLAGHFGIFQSLMAALGWAAGEGVGRWIGPWDHWLAAVVLTVIAGRFAFDAARGGCSEARPSDPTRGWSLVGLSVATSIDAAGAGIGIGALAMAPWQPILLVGITAAFLSLVAGVAGRRLGLGGAGIANALGAVVLLGVAISIPLQHLGRVGMP